MVDDDTVSRHVLIQALANAELPHVAVGSGTEALAQIEKVQPSLVLLDLVMPPPDGYQILRILRARAETRDLPVVVLTALEADEEIAKAFEAGADDFVRKPFKPVELVARIRGSAAPARCHRRSSRRRARTRAWCSSSRRRSPRTSTSAASSSPSSSASPRWPASTA